jgi:hypothetical protein
LVSAMVSRTFLSIERLKEVIPFRSLLLFSVCLIFATSLHAGFYKWTDEKGQVHFSDRPVSGSSTEVKIRQTHPNGAGSDISEQRLSKMKRMLGAFEDDRNAKKEARQKANQDREKRKKKCMYARDKYNSHNRAAGIYNFNKDGERKYLDEVERQRHMQSLKVDVERWCR